MAKKQTFEQVITSEMKSLLESHDKHALLLAANTAEGTAELFYTQLRSDLFSEDRKIGDVTRTVGEFIHRGELTVYGELFALCPSLSSLIEKGKPLAKGQLQDLVKHNELFVSGMVEAEPVIKLKKEQLKEGRAVLNGCTWFSNVAKKEKERREEAERIERAMMEENDLLTSLGFERDSEEGQEALKKFHSEKHKKAGQERAKKRKEEKELEISELIEKDKDTVLNMLQAKLGVSFEKAQPLSEVSPKILIHSLIHEHEYRNPEIVAMLKAVQELIEQEEPEAEKKAA